MLRLRVVLARAAVSGIPQNRHVAAKGRPLLRGGRAKENKRRNTQTRGKMGQTRIVACKALTKTEHAAEKAQRKPRSYVYFLARKIRRDLATCTSFRWTLHKQNGIALALHYLPGKGL